MKTKKPFVNVFAKEAKTDAELGLWNEAAFFAAKLYELAKIAHAYHNGVKFPGVLPQPIATSIMNTAARLFYAESSAISVRWCRAQEKKIVKEVPSGKHLRAKRGRKG
jgi:hypothetical protein